MTGSGRSINEGHLTGNLQSKLPCKQKR